MLDEIIGHRTNGRKLKQQDAFITNKSGTRRPRETTKGWKSLLQWKNKSSTWIALKDVKESYPVQLTEYARSTRIAEEPAFAWWIPHTLRERNRIIAKIKSKYWVKTYKYGIKIPKNAIRLGKRQYPLVRCHLQRNAKCSSRIRSLEKI